MLFLEGCAWAYAMWILPVEIKSLRSIGDIPDFHRINPPANRTVMKKTMKIPAGKLTGWLMKKEMPRPMIVAAVENRPYRSLNTCITFKSHYVQINAE